MAKTLLSFPPPRSPNEAGAPGADLIYFSVFNDVTPIEPLEHSGFRRRATVEIPVGELMSDVVFGAVPQEERP